MEMLLRGPYTRASASERTSKEQFAGMRSLGCVSRKFCIGKFEKKQVCQRYFDRYIRSTAIDERSKRLIVFRYVCNRNAGTRRRLGDVLRHHHFVRRPWRYGGGISILSRLTDIQLETPPFLYFLGIALAVFTIRRISDERRERMQRLGG